MLWAKLEENLKDEFSVTAWVTENLVGIDNESRFECYGIGVSVEHLRRYVE